MSLLRRWFPAPLLSVGVFLLWLVLARGFDLVTCATALALATAIPRLTLPLLPVPARRLRPAVVLRFSAIVVFDVVMSNLAVGRDVLRWHRRRPAYRFIRVPLELRDPLGLAMLAVVTTIVPGTVWSELAADCSSLLLHVWDAEDEAAFITRYKARYEAPLREIFE